MVYFFRLLNTLTERFGLLGALLLLGCLFVWRYSTPEQKVQIIEVYILNNGVSQVWPSIVLSILFVLVLFAQRHVYQRRERERRKDIARIGKEKSDLQQKATDTKLQHVHRSED